MDTLNSSHTANISGGDNTGLFSGSPYSTLEIILIILVAGSLSLVTVIGNILVMLSIKVWLFMIKVYPSVDDLEEFTQTRIQHVW